MRASACAFTCVLAAALVLSAPTGARAAGGFDGDRFARFIDALGGRSAAREYVYSGDAYDYATGGLIARVEGYQVARVIVSARHAYVWRRAFLLYRSPEDGRILASYPEVRADRAKPLLSLTRYELTGDRLQVRTWVGGDGTSRVIDMPDDTTAIREGERDVFRRTYVSGDPARATFEIQETTVRRGRAGSQPDVRSTLFKVGEAPLFPSQVGRYVVNVTWRPCRRADLPPSLREFLRTEAAAIARLPDSLAAAKRELGLTAN